MSSPAVTTPGLPEKAAEALVNSFGLASVTQRLRYHVQDGERSDVKEFQICCISLAKGIDFAIANNEIPNKVEEFPLLLKQVCKHTTDVYTTTVLMISVKHACQLGWFSDIESQELTAIADEMMNSFGSFGNTSPDIKSPEGTFSQIMERFYPFVKIGHVLVSLEVKAGYKMLAHDFHISKKMPHSPQEKIRLFVVQTDNIDTSACISNPPEVSLLLNGKGLEKRDPGPQLPSNVTALLKYGTNLLQVMGNSKGHYIIVIAFTSLVLPPENPVLKDYLQSGFIESSPDSDIIEGPSRVSLNCPISLSRIKLPVKGQLCKHLQCFDFWNYYHINMRNPSWRCPHCNQSVCYPEICLDQNMVKILKESGNNAADVTIHADGTWKVAKEIEQTEEPVQDVIIHDLEDSGPVVLDLTGDDDDAEMEIFGDQKPCLLDAQGQSNSNDTSKDASDDDYISMLNLSDVISLDQVILNHLNTGTGQELSNLPQIPLPQDPTPSPRDRPAATSTIPNPAPQFSQVHASPVTPAGTYQRWNPTYSSQASSVTTSSQSRRHPVPVTRQSPPIHRVLNSQPNSYFIPSPNSNHVRQNPSGPTVQSVSRTSDLTSNHGSTQRQHTSTGPTVQSVSRASDLTTNHGSTQRQHPIAPTVQSVTRTSDLMDVDSTTPDLTNWHPRMRGSITPGSYYPALDRMIIRPTQQSQTTPHGSQPVQTPPVQTSQAQPPFPTAAFRPETVLVNQNLPGECHPLIDGETRAIQSNNKGKTKSGQVVDFRTLLTQCAQAISTGDKTTAIDLLLQIRQDSSPLGDASQRLAHCFANALEARLQGSTGLVIQTYYNAITSLKKTSSDTLKAYRVYLSLSPFVTLMYLFSIKMILEAAKDAPVLHIVDFGILYGFQWQMFVQHLSNRKDVPRKLRITGIELPQRGFRPAERIEETGRRLAEYCKRFSVPFEYKAIASQNWETIRIDDLDIRPNEVLAVNAGIRLKNLLDETGGEENCPRDAFLKLIRKMNPEVFVHSIVNGSFNAPFFTSRFKEAVYHYSALFDMFDSTLPRDNQERIRFERDYYGREAMNVIACEEADRVERPETYKQWQVRMVRAGFKQKPVKGELVELFREKMKRWHYHKDFVVDENSKWLLQGWKGRTLYASSSWVPA